MKPLSLTTILSIIGIGIGTLFLFGTANAYHARQLETKCTKEVFDLTRDKARKGVGVVDVDHEFVEAFAEGVRRLPPSLLPPPEIMVAFDDMIRGFFTVAYENKGGKFVDFFSFTKEDCSGIVVTIPMNVFDLIVSNLGQLANE